MSSKIRFLFGLSDRERARVQTALRLMEEGYGHRSKRERDEARELAHRLDNFTARISEQDFEDAADAARARLKEIEETLADRGGIDALPEKQQLAFRRIRNTLAALKGLFSS